MVASAKKLGSSDRGGRNSKRPVGTVLLLTGIIAAALAVGLVNLRGKKEAGPASFRAGTNAAESAGVARDPDEIVAELITDANRDLEAKRADQAALKLRKAIELKPDDEDAHYNLGIALAATGNAVDARSEYEKALEIFPDYVEAHNNLGNLLMNQNEFGLASAHFQKALEISPENPSAHNNLGTSLARQGRVIEALPEFSEAVRLKADFLQARLNLANGYMTLSRWDEAGQELATILRMDPTYEPAQKAMARLRSRQRGTQ